MQRRFQLGETDPDLFITVPTQHERKGAKGRREIATFTCLVRSSKRLYKARVRETSFKDISKSM